MSDSPQMSIHSDPDVHITIYDAAGLKLLTGVHRVVEPMPLGLYRVHLDRCGFVNEHVIVHDSPVERVFDAPVLESAAPLEIARTSPDEAQDARKLSLLDSTPPLGSYEARLFVFVRSTGRHDGARPLLDEPIAVHDIAGRRIALLSQNHQSAGSTNRALSCQIAPGPYRLRVGNSRNDLALTIPPGRAAHVFVAGGRHSALRSARVYLPRAGEAFDPRGGIARAMESVLWALRYRREPLPEIARELLGAVDDDLSFGIACAHLARRQNDWSTFDSIMRRLGEYSRDVPDVDILARAREATLSTSAVPALTTPPLYRASLVLALEHEMKVATQSAFMEAAKTGHDDSVWCTWRARWWEERWIDPTVAELRDRDGARPSDAKAIARSTKLPLEVVELALQRIDARPLRSNDENLFDHLASFGGPMPADRAYKLVDQALDLVAELHEQRLVHSGLSPGSLVIRNDRVVALLPSHIAVDVGPAAPAVHSDDDAVRFMAPEVVLDPATSSSAADVWSIAAILHFLLTLDLPRERRIDQSEADAVRQPDTASRRELTELPPRVAACLERALAGNPRERFPDGGVFRTALAAAIDDSSSDRHVRSWRRGAAHVLAAPRNLLSYLWRLLFSRFVLRRAAAVVAALVFISGCVYLSEVASNAQAALRRTHASVLQEIGRQLVLDGRPSRALPYLVAARTNGQSGTPLRMLFHTAASDLALVRQFPHDSDVTNAAFSPDERRIVTATRDGFARVWDVATGAQIASFKHDAAIASAVFSADGKWIVTASEDRTARVWNASTGAPVSPRLEHRSFVRSAMFSPDGTRVVTAGLDRAAIWQASSGTLEHQLVHKDAVWSAAFSPDGLSVVTASRDRTAQIWSVDTGRPTAPPLEHQDIVWSALFSADSKRVVTASQDRTARVWSASTGLPSMPPLEHRDGVLSAAFDVRGDRIVTASYDNVVRVWNAANGTPITPPLEHRGSVVSAAFSPDGTRVVTASTDETARIWDASTGRPIPPLLEHMGPVNSALFSASGTSIVTASNDGTARIWDAVDDGRPIEIAVDSAIRSAAIRPDGKRLATTVGDKTVRMWDVRTGSPVGPVLVLQHLVRTVGFSGDGKWLVTTSDDRIAQIWDAETGNRVTRPFEHPGRLTSAAFSADRTLLVTTSGEDSSRWGYELQLWETRTEKPIRLAVETSGQLRGAWLSHDNTKLVTLDEGQGARVWEVATGKPLTPPLAHPGRVRSASFSPDGTRVITASDDRTAKIWSASTGAVLVTPLELPGHVQFAAFSPDGERVVTVSDDKAACIWDATSGKPLTPRLTHRDPIVAAAFTLDGARLITVDGHVVRTWDIDLDRGSREDWAEVANKSPFVLENGVLLPRSPGPGLMVPHADALPSS